MCPTNSASPLRGSPPECSSATTSGRVLLVKPTYKDGWDISGGYVEPGESPKQAAARELEEGLGVTQSLGRLLVIDRAPVPDEGDKLLFIFDGGTVGQDVDDLALDRQEIDRAEFVAPEQASAYLSRRLLERAMSAVAGGHDPYLEHGMR